MWLNFWAMSFSSSFHFDWPCPLGWVVCSLILLELSLSIHNRVFISRCYSILAFSFSYIENTKTLGILHWLEFLSLDSLSFILVHVKKDYIFFFRIAKLNWKFHFEKHIIDWKLKFELCIVFIFIYFTCWVITSPISWPHLLNKKELHLLSKKDH